MKTAFLSPEEKSQGRRHYLNFVNWNGIGFRFLSEAVIYLIAIELGANNLQLGYISSALQFAGLAMLFLPVAVEGRNLIRIYFLSWLFRGLICALYFLIPFIPGEWGVWLTLSVYSVYAVFRILGVVISRPVQQSISTPQNMGDLVLRMSMNFQRFSIISLSISFFITTFPPLKGMHGLLLLIALGIFANTMAAFQLRSIPCRETIAVESALQFKGIQRLTAFMTAVIKDFAAIVKSRNAPIYYTSLLSFMLLQLAGMSIPYIRKVQNFSGSMVFLFTILTALSAYIATRAIRPYVEKTGSRSMMVIASLALFFVSIPWIFMPQDMWPPVLYLLGFLQMSLIMIILQNGSRLLLLVFPEKNRIAFSSMVDISIAIVSLLAGFLSGLLINTGEADILPRMHSYSLFFVFMTLSCAAMLFASLAVKEKRAFSIGQFTRLLFNPSSILDLLRSNKIAEGASAAEESRLINDMARSRSTIAVQELRLLLKSPALNTKRRAIEALRFNPIDELCRDIVEQAKDVYSYTRINAIETLDAYNNTNIITELKSIAAERDYEVAAMALKSLAKLDDNTQITRVRTLLSRKGGTVKSRIHLLYAYSLMDSGANFMKDIFTYIDQSNGDRYNQMVLTFVSGKLDKSMPLSHYFSLENVTEGDGFYRLLSDALIFEDFLKTKERLKKMYKNNKYREIWKWVQQQCSKMLTHLRTETPIALCEAILHFPLDKVDRSNSLGTLYFLYELLKMKAKSE